MTEWTPPHVNNERLIYARIVSNFNATSFMVFCATYYLKSPIQQIMNTW